MAHKSGNQPPTGGLNRLLLGSWNYRAPVSGRTCALPLVSGWSSLAAVDTTFYELLVGLLLVAALLFWVGYLDMTVARSAPPRI